MSLFRRVFLINAALVTAAALMLMLTPVTVSTPIRTGQAALLLAGVAMVLMVSYSLMRRAFEAERRDASSQVIAAQEAERRRVALELHDEVGQALTGLMLQLKSASESAGGGPLEAQMHDALQVSRESVEAVRDIARGLRPEALEDFGLRSALVALASTVTERTRLPVRRSLPNRLPLLSPEVELVVYRVAQEALTNVARHAQATGAELAVTVTEQQLELRVSDDGRGVHTGAEGSGIAGMRERALLAHGTLTVRRARTGGTEVRLRIPLRAAVR